MKMQIVLKRPDELIPYERNIKKHDEAQVDRIVASIKAAKGFDQPIVVDKNMVIIKGHGRRLAAIKMGMPEVPVIVRSDLNEAEVAAARLNDNRAAISGIDTEMFREELARLNVDLIRGVFDDKELDFMIADLGQMVDDPLITDVEAAVLEQEQEAQSRADAVSERRVPLAKAFGFKDISGGSEIYLTRFMLKVESETGMQGEAALVEYMKKVVA